MLRFGLGASLLLPESPATYDYGGYTMGVWGGTVAPLPLDCAPLHDRCLGNRVLGALWKDLAPHVIFLLGMT